MELHKLVDCRIGRLGLILTAFSIGSVSAQTSVGIEFFEKEIRPVLAGKCYGCHSSKSKSPMGGLVLDTKTGIKRGGNGGPVLVAGDPSSSRLYKALTYNHTDLRMPPSGRLAEETVAAFEKWIAAGAPDPREETKEAASVSTAKRGMSIEAGRKWWAFQPLQPQPQPRVSATRWVRNGIDAFILARLENEKLQPSPEADGATLIARVSLNLTGLRPSYEEVQAFLADKDPKAYDKLVDRLLASPRYGEVSAGDVIGWMWLDMGKTTRPQRPLTRPTRSRGGIATG